MLNWPMDTKSEAKSIPCWCNYYVIIMMYDIYFYWEKIINNAGFSRLLPWMIGQFVYCLIMTSNHIIIVMWWYRQLILIETSPLCQMSLHVEWQTINLYSFVSLIQTPEWKHVYNRNLWFYEQRHVKCLTWYAWQNEVHIFSLTKESMSSCFVIFLNLPIFVTFILSKLFLALSCQRMSSS